MAAVGDSERPGSSTDSSLLRRARAGEQHAWARLVEWAGPLVYRWCGRAGLSAEDREDAFQEVFLKVARGLGRFDADRPGATFRGWLLTVTRNALTDLARYRLNRPRGEGGSDAYQRLLALTEEQLSAGDPSTPDAKRAQLRHALGLLRADFPERAWRAFWRTAVDGLPAPEA